MDSEDIFHSRARYRKEFSQMTTLMALEGSWIATVTTPLGFSSKGFYMGMVTGFRKVSCSGARWKRTTSRRAIGKGRNKTSGFGTRKYIMMLRLLSTRLRKKKISFLRRLISITMSYIHPHPVN